MKSTQIPIIVLLLGILLAIARSLPQEHKEMVLRIPYIGFPLYLFVVAGSFPPHIIPRCHDKDKVQQWLRPGDVIVDVPAKSGTTWTIQTVQSVRTHGRYREFTGLDDEVPWMEWRHYPGETWEDQMKYTKMYSHGFNDTFYKYRVFKSHETADVIGFRDDIKYVIVVRKPFESVSSMINMARNFNPQVSDIWHTPSFNIQSENDLFWMFMKGGMIDHQICEFINGWWPHLNKPNVFANHYTTLIKADRKQTIKRLAKFLGESLTEEEISLVINETSIEEMKKNEHKYIKSRMLEEFKKMGKLPKDFEGFILPGGFIGKGGESKSMDIKEEFPNLEKRVNDHVHACIKDKEALKWLYNQS